MLFRSSVERVCRVKPAAQTDFHDGVVGAIVGVIQARERGEQFERGGVDALDRKFHAGAVKAVRIPDEILVADGLTVKHQGRNGYYL